MTDDLKVVFGTTMLFLAGALIAAGANIAWGATGALIAAGLILMGYGYALLFSARGNGK